MAGVTSVATRREVLHTFKHLHRAAQRVFAGDEFALSSARDKINGDFRHNAHVDSPPAIQELLQLGRDCREVLLKQVVQAQRQESGRYALHIRPEHEKFDNTVYRDDITEQDYKAANRKGKKSCLEAAKDMKKDLS
ncbi:hypothetical protein TCAL_03350 [Tigriopus californicus]|uniref:Complex III assembly factor LYRM7 n=1 Tax=Tigriopus californicus TaxID=6832 RepID=A0A553P5Q4_TIGCA|nr:complex III assembly factor LYRM7-like [Tigriopus californicus]TRY73013.1 hypothetical protein TCAL_03350 [Tigriopus californicus]|eukprot:TCALIF_03350-PA protein Name:"Similar to lyrm7 Complex III assembly factor LYRM7 (Xenopus tropicalis)" AED:0.06 eAED:0.06 QI:0/-1/0/1/-1/1/1/0/135